MDESTTATPGTAASEAAARTLAMSLLAAHIPLTLLLDLAENFGPPSAQILASESEPVPAWWLPRPSAAESSSS
ncbi:MAG TPA: hypothetical protein VHC41_01565 [Mycobacteriales bacterium]|jgi:hypothetical protein|nr:hypothetical protein [Mycobacteriales bacterium]